MSFHHLDQYATTASPITRLPAVVRVLGTVVLALGASLLPLGAWAQLGALAGIVVLLFVMARIPVRAILLRMAGPLAFVSLASFALLFLVPGETVLNFGGLGISGEGLVRFGSTLGRAGVALSAAVVLVSTTRFPELLEALRTLRMPRAVTTSLGLAYRLLYVTMDELERMRRAAKSRNLGAGATRRRHVLASVATAALRRSLDRGERTHRAMLARGFTGDIVSLHDSEIDTRAASILGLLVIAVACITSSAYLGQ